MDTELTTDETADNKDITKLHLEKTATDGKVKQAKDLTVEQSKSKEELVRIKLRKKMSAKN
ncbi:hypothetical protein AGMMS49921_13750 [Endomicrobiia bacterium]|nr:hypothetical protein AGMMS49921_13750 [Endomicrobiia bacterium]